MMPIRMRCLRPLAVSSGAVGPRPDPPGRIPQPASRRDLRWLALDGRTDGDVADLDVIRLLDGKGDGAGDGAGGDGELIAAAAHTWAGAGAAAHRGDPRALDGQPRYVDAERAAGLRDRDDRRPRLRVRRGRPVRLAGRPAPARPNPGRLRPQLRPAGTARIHAPAPAQQPARVPRTAPGPARTHSGLPGPDLVRHRLDLLT